MLKSNIKHKRFLKLFRNKFFLISIVFAAWMLFIDSNSWFIHDELNDDIDKLNAEKNYYKKEISKDQKEIKKLSTEEGLEKYGREKYNMKKDNEEIYIIEYEDSIAKQKRDE